MAGRIWGELSRSAAQWTGLGLDTCSSGPVLLGGLDGGAHSLRDRADRALGSRASLRSRDGHAAEGATTDVPSRRR